MNRKATLLSFMFCSFCFMIIAQKSEIDLSNWKLELPTGNTLVYPEVLNFQNSKEAQPFLKESEGGGLLFVAFPTEGKSRAKYSKTFLREQLEPKNDSKNWSFDEGGKLTVEFEVAEMSMENPGKYHRTVLVQLVGKTSQQQMKDWGLSKAESIPLIKVFWQNERIRVQRKTLRYKSLTGADLFKKESWINGSGAYFSEKIGFEKGRLEVEVTEGKVVLRFNDEEMVFADSNIKKWPFDSFFNVGNYLQSNEEGARSQVKYSQIEVTH